MCGVIVFLSLAGGGILGYIPAMLLSSLLKVKFENDTDDYEPIKKLKGIGFLDTRPKASEYPEAKFNTIQFNQTLQSIVTNDNCVVVN